MSLSFFVVQIENPQPATPPATAAGAAVAAAPVIPKDVQVANKPPAATLPIVAWVPAASEPATTPK